MLRWSANSSLAVGSAPPGFALNCIVPSRRVRLQLGFPYNPIIALAGVLDLILRFSNPCREQRDDLVAAAPDIVRRAVPGVADVLPDSVAMPADGSLRGPLT